jgi:hypothetical protein
MRSVAAMSAVTALFVGTLVGGLSYSGALDAATLRGAKKDDPARAGWLSHSHAAAGFSIQLPPRWQLAKAHPYVVFEARQGKRVVASLTVTRAPKGAHEVQSAATRSFLRGDRLLTFRTAPRRAASFSRVFREAAESFDATGSA